MPAPLPQRRPAPDPGDDLVRVSASALIALRHAAEGLPLRSPRRLGSMAGPHLSAFKGRGMEFEETRPYQPGDDVRIGSIVFTFEPDQDDPEDFQP